jgi:hypothetical protein
LQHSPHHDRNGRGEVAKVRHALGALLRTFPLTFERRGHTLLSTIIGRAHGRPHSR